MVSRLAGLPLRRVMVTGCGSSMSAFDKGKVKILSSRRKLTDVPSPPPHVMLYDEPATTTAGTEVKAIWGVCAMVVAVQAAHARIRLKRRIAPKKERMQRERTVPAQEKGVMRGEG